MHASCCIADFISPFFIHIFLCEEANMSWENDAAANVVKINLLNCTML